MSNKSVKIGLEIVDETKDINSVRKLTKDLEQMGYAIKEIEQLNKTSNAHDNAAKSADNHRESFDKLEKELGQATSALEELDGITEQVSDGLSELAAEGDNTAASMESVRAGFAKVAASGTALALAAKGAITFESAMAGVKKTVEASDEQMEALGRRIKELSVETAQSAEDVATIAALGGQLGIAYGDLEDFITLASKVGVAFNLSAEQAGESVAKLANVYQIPIQEIERLMDAVNTLGNNTAAKEAEIVESMKRIGGTARGFGLAAEEAAALADAMIALGQTPETASTAIKALLRELNNATSKGKDFQEALGRIGISAKQLAEDIRNNPQLALSDFLEKVSELDKQAQSNVLDKLFGDGHAGEIQLLTNSLDTYKKALELVNDETKKAGALNKEVDAQMGSTSARMKQARESIENLTSDIGENLLPIIGDMADATRDTGLALSKFAQDYPHITKLATALAVAKVATMGLSAATGKQITVSGLMNAKMLQTGLNAAAAAQGMDKATIATASWTKATKAFRGALALISANPIFFAITAITAAITAIDAIIDSTEKWEESTIAAYDALSKLQEKASEGIDIELNDETLKPVKDAIADIDAELDSLSDDTGMFDFLSDSIGLWDSNIDKMHKLSEEKQSLINRENQLRQQIAERAAAEEATAEKARAYAAEQKKVAAENLELLLSRKAQLEAQDKTESAYYQHVISSIHKLNGEIDKGQDAARKALEQLGLSAAELQTGISTSAQTAIDSFSTAAKEFGKDTDSMSKIYKAALKEMSNEKELEAFRKKFTEIAKAAGFSAEKIKEMTDSVSPAFAKLGVDVDAVMTGISDSAETAMSNFASAIEAAQQSGTNSMKLTQAAIDAVLKTLNSNEEFNAFDKNLEKLGLRSQATAAQIEKINAGKTKGANDSTEATKKSTEATEKQSIATEKQSESTKKLAETTKIVAAAEKENSEAKRESVVHSQQLYDTNNLNEQQLKSMLQLSQKLKEGGDLLHSAGFNVDYRKRLQDTADAYRQINAVVDDMNDSISDGSINLSDLELAFSRAAGSAHELDDATTEHIRAEIDRAKKAIKELTATAKSEVQDLEAELAGIKGDDSARRDLEQKRKLAAIEDKLAAARKRNNTEEIAAYEKSLDLQRQIFAEKEKEIKKAAEQRKQSEREKSRNERKELHQEPTRMSSNSSVAPFDPKVFSQKFVQTMNTELNNVDTMHLAESTARAIVPKIARLIRDDWERLPR